jgi:hypothetical protein
MKHVEAKGKVILIANTDDSRVFSILDRSCTMNTLTDTNY